MNPLSKNFQTTASKVVRTQVNQLKTRKDLQTDANILPDDSIELSEAERAQAALRAYKETTGRKKTKHPDGPEEADLSSPSAPFSDLPPQPELPERNPNEDTPPANLEAASRVIASQVSTSGPPAELKNVPGTAELKMEPAPILPIEEIHEKPDPLPPS